MADKGYYRVFDLRDSISSALSYGAMTAYFHNSIGGYHAAKLKIYEDLINHQLFNYPHCAGVIDMLNTRYVIRHTPAGKDTVILNESALGPVWFVRSVQFKPTASAVMKALSNFHPEDTAVVFAADSSSVAYDAALKDTDGSIELVKHDNDDLTYLSETSDRRFAVFSEVFYKRGWRARSEKREESIIRTNYVLLGLCISPRCHMFSFFIRAFAYYMRSQIPSMGSRSFLMILAAGEIV